MRTRRRVTRALAASQRKPAVVCSRPALSVLAPCALSNFDSDYDCNSDLYDRHHHQDPSSRLLRLERAHGDVLNALLLALSLRRRSSALALRSGGLRLERRLRFRLRLRPPGPLSPAAPPRTRTRRRVTRALAASQRMPAVVRSRPALSSTSTSASPTPAFPTWTTTTTNWTPRAICPVEDAHTATYYTRSCCLSAYAGGRLLSPCALLDFDLNYDYDSDFDYDHQDHCRRLRRLERAHGDVLHALLLALSGAALCHILQAGASAAAVFVLRWAAAHTGEDPSPSPRSLALRSDELRLRLQLQFRLVRPPPPPGPLQPAAPTGTRTRRRPTRALAVSQRTPAVVHSRPSLSSTSTSASPTPAIPTWTTTTTNRTPRAICPVEDVHTATSYTRSCCFSAYAGGRLFSPCAALDLDYDYDFDHRYHDQDPSPSARSPALRSD
ncbi:hypothetical protein C8Q78DRAFT_994502 [Trametes maxima]|nr:hypothetical protein C8Q78DRAFT_994502 [Trametes maxima]